MFSQYYTHSNVQRKVFFTQFELFFLPFQLHIQFELFFLPFQLHIQFADNNDVSESSDSHLQINNGVMGLVELSTELSDSEKRTSFVPLSEENIKPGNNPPNHY